MHHDLQHFWQDGCGGVVIEIDHKAFPYCLVEMFQEYLFQSLETRSWCSEYGSKPKSTDVCI
jgi:hypothetical protein